MKKNSTDLQLEITKTNKIIAALILMVLGLSFIVKDIWFLNLLWQIPLTILGILKIKEKDYVQGIVLVVIGTIFLIDWIIPINIKDILIGIFFILSGLKVLIDSLK